MAGWIGGTAIRALGGGFGSEGGSCIDKGTFLKHSGPDPALVAAATAITGFTVLDAAVARVEALGGIPHWILSF
jgi:hypothetical protein